MIYWFIESSLTFKILLFFLWHHTCSDICFAFIAKMGLFSAMTRRDKDGAIGDDEMWNHLTLYFKALWLTKQVCFYYRNYFFCVFSQHFVQDVHFHDLGY